jgi:hypothetical protein
MGSNLCRITYTSPCPVRLKMIEEYVKIGHIISIGCPFYLVPQFGEYIALSTGCPFYLVLSLRSTSHFLHDVHFILSLSLGSISHFLQGVQYLVPQFGKYIAPSTECPISCPSVWEVYRTFYRVSNILSLSLGSI